MELLAEPFITPGWALARQFLAALLYGRFTPVAARIAAHITRAWGARLGGHANQPSIPALEAAVIVLYPALHSLHCSAALGSFRTLHQRFLLRS